MSNKHGTVVCLLFSVAAVFSFIALSDSHSTVNWVVAGLMGVASGLLGIILVIRNRWAGADLFVYLLGSLGIIIGWGSWLVILLLDPHVSPSDPIINITWFAAVPGGVIQVIYALTAARDQRISQKG